jgi:hypothetical protein
MLVAEAAIDTEGAGLTVKLATEEPVPPKVVTAITPVTADNEGVAVICVGLLTTNEAAATPPKVTADAPVKLVPVITTDVVPAQAVAGKKLVTVGGPSTGSALYNKLVVLHELCVPHAAFVLICK